VEHETVAYRDRIIDRILRERLGSAGAVILEGAKATGKTLSARQAAGSEVLLDVDINAQQAIAIDPGLVLPGPTPRLIDEWQEGGTALWNSVRRAVDERQTPGQFILTGSATPADDVRRHSGAGRFSRVRMRPMSLNEVGLSTGTISLSGLFAGESPSCPDPGLTVPELLAQLAIGGWPANLGLDLNEALQSNADYLDSVREVDIPGMTAIRRDPTRLDRLIRSLARNTATEVKIAVLARETSVDEGAGLARSTIYDYLAALERLMITEDVPAWAPHLRSRATLRQQPKRHFVDPSLALAALHAGPEALLRDLNFAGFLFESLIVRDIRVLSEPLGGKLFHYRDSSGVEADMVLQLPDGRWGAFEVKLGASRVDEGAATLRRFADSIDTRRTGEPAILGIITNASYGYLRPDGIAVIPIAALRP